MNLQNLTNASFEISPKKWLHQCNRCNYKWSSTKELPQTCANKQCRSRYWNKERTDRISIKSKSEFQSQNMVIIRHLKNLRGLAEDDDKFRFVLITFLEQLDYSEDPEMRMISSDFRRKYVGNATRSLKQNE